MNMGLSLPVLGVPDLFGGEAFNESTVADLEHWYDAATLSTLYQDSGKTTPVTSDGDPVGAWVDRIVAADEIAQAVTAAKPTYRASVAALNSKPALQLDGGDWLIGAWSASLAQPNTIFMVVNLDAVGTGVQYMCEGDDAAARESLRLDTNWEMYAGSSVVTGGAASANSTILTVVFNGASSLLYANGTQTASGNPGAHAIDGATIGARYDGVNPMAGHVGEYMIYSRALSAAEKNLVQNYLAAKYGISITEFS
jgi:large exoprotein involved in heme utilization and adhesion